MKLLTAKDVRAIFPQAIRRTYPPGQIIVYQGDKPSHMFFLAKGSVKYYDIDQNGNEKILHIVGTNGFFSMFFGFGAHDEVQAFYTSLDEVEVILVPMDQFRQMVNQNTLFSNQVLYWFVEETEHIMQRIRSLEKSDARVKVLEALFYLLGTRSKREMAGTA